MKQTAVSRSKSITVRFLSLMPRIPDRMARSDVLLAQDPECPHTILRTLDFTSYVHCFA